MPFECKKSLSNVSGSATSRAALDWYELFAEQAGAAALAQASGEEYAFQGKAQDEDQEGDEGDDIGDLD